MPKKIIQALLFILGLLIFGYLIYQLGWDKLLESISLMGWWWLPIIGLAMTWQVFHAYAWHEVLSFFGHRLAFSQLFKIKMIAEAINMLVPSGNIGGDTLRAHLLRDYIPLSDGIPSVVIDKTLEFITKLLFNIAGFSIALFFIDIPATWFWGCVIYLSVVFFFYALLILIQIKGISGWMLTFTKLIPPLHKGLEKRKSQLQTLV